MPSKQFRPASPKHDACLSPGAALTPLLRSSVSELLWNKMNVNKSFDMPGNSRGFDKWPRGSQRAGRRLPLGMGGVMGSPVGSEYPPLLRLT